MLRRRSACRSSAAVGELDQQAGEQRESHARRDGEMQIGDVGGRGAARIDDDDLAAALALAAPCAGTAPDGTRRDCCRRARRDRPARNPRRGPARCRAEGAPVARDRRGHAEPRIGVDVGRAEKAFDQLVGGVIVLGQQLAGDDRRRPRRAHAASMVSRKPSATCRARASHDTRTAVDLGMEQPVFERQRLAERRALGAEPAAVGGMRRIAGDRRRRPSVRRRDDAAADAAIGAGRADQVLDRDVPPLGA